MFFSAHCVFGVFRCSSLQVEVQDILLDQWSLRSNPPPLIYAEQNKPWGFPFCSLQLLGFTQLFPIQVTRVCGSNCPGSVDVEIFSCGWTECFNYSSITWLLWARVLYFQNNMSISHAKLSVMMLQCMFGLQAVAMQLLGYSGWLLRCC